MLFEKIIKSRLLIEVGSIVFAVLFALWVNEWRSNVKIRNLTKEQRIRIFNEISANKKELENVLKDNQIRLDSLLSFQKQKSWWKNKNLEARDIGWGYNFADLKSTAWETTLLLNIAPSLDAEFLSCLSAIHKLQEKYEEFNTELLRDFGEQTALIASDRRMALNKHKFNLMILQELGGNLIKDYTKFLDTYK